MDDSIFEGHNVFKCTRKTLNSFTTASKVSEFNPDICFIFGPAIIKKPLFEQLLIKAPKAVSFDDLGQTLDIDTNAKDGLKKFKGLVKNLQKNVRKAKHIKIDVKKDKIALIPSKRWAFLYSSLLTVNDLSPNQRKSVELIKQFATVPIATLEEACGVPRATIRREMNDLVQKGLLEAVRQGRGQAFRLS